MPARKIMAETAADSYQKRAVALALSANASRNFNSSINNWM